MAEEARDFIVVGGGMVGAAIAYGLGKRGARVVVLDEGDTAVRAARVNLGLVWLQSKGDGMPDYGRWSRRSVDLWPAFDAELRELTGVATELEQNGGVTLCLGEEELEERARTIRRMHNQVEPWVYETEMIDRRHLQSLMPKARLGRDVVGASWCPHDGISNPLRTLQAMHAGMKRVGVAYRPDAPVRSIGRDGAGFAAQTPAGTFRAAKVVVAAGHGIPALAAQLGLQAPIRPERGQLLVTERMERILPFPAGGLRQTADGTIMIGSTREKVSSLDTRTTTASAITLAKRALRILPDLVDIRIVRSWAGLRVLAPDGFPVYQESESHPGAYATFCHSGNTLAAVHAEELAPALLEPRLPDRLAVFHPRRFETMQAA
ncbi:MAG: FAD-binding oxidoreductase [Alphaproteobacteria bacterium]|nr:FAD-binding oxidoreductase [Alphaproteobacteria bacterium]